MPNPFRNRTKEEIAKMAEEKRAIDAMLANAKESATHILSSGRGAKYVRDLENTKDALVRYLIKNVNPDPLKDAFFLRTSLAKLSGIMDLLDNMEADARGK